MNRPYSPLSGASPPLSTSTGDCTSCLHPNQAVGDFISGFLESLKVRKRRTDRDWIANASCLGRILERVKESIVEQARRDPFERAIGGIVFREDQVELRQGRVCLPAWRSASLRSAAVNSGSVPGGCRAAGTLRLVHCVKRQAGLHFGDQPADAPVDVHVLGRHGLRVRCSPCCCVW